MVEFLREIERQVKEILPEKAMITDMEIEGPEIIIYTKNVGLFLEDESLIKSLASKLKKRFVLRSDSSVLMDAEKAMEEIRAIIPEDAGVTNITFNPVFNEVIIEARKLGLVIGHGGETLKRITMKTNWTPKLLRVPSAESGIMRGIRDVMVRESDDVKKMLKRTGKRIYREQTKTTDWIRITALGGCREVGRSCHLLETPESKVLIDCGLNVGTSNVENAFPYMSSIDFSMEELDAVIISHAHLDHSGFLPYLFHYGYDGPVYCTPPTRDLMALLQRDYTKVIAKNAQNPPYSEKNIKHEVKNTITRQYGEVTDITPDIRLTFHNAGHILGSAMVHLHIGEGAHNLIYSGDIKFGYTELFDPAETRFPRLETIILESTYGGNKDVQPPRYVSDKKLIELIKGVMQKNGTVLIPSFAIGRAQEVMLVIENYAKQKGWDIPVYLDGMTKEASAMHTAYPEYLKRSLQRRVLHNDSPFDSNIFQNVDPKERDDIIDKGRAVILAPAGMMNGGPVLDYFKKTCEDPKNALVFVGYQAEGSVGKKIQRGAKDIALDNGGKVEQYKINMGVQTIEGYSGHADYNQLLGFFKKLTPKPDRVLTVHGEESKTINFARSLAYKFHVEASAPRTLDSIRLK